MEENRSNSGEQVHILGFNEVDEDGTIVSVFSPPPKGEKIPEGMIWHGILGKFVPEDWADKEMWVAKSETIYADDDEDAMSRRNKEVPEVSLEKSLLKAVEGLSNGAALALLEAFRKIPKAVKSSVIGVYDSLGSLGVDTSIDDVKSRLVGLSKACGDRYKSIYDKVLKDVKKILPKIQARIFTESIEG